MIRPSPSARRDNIPFGAYLIGLKIVTAEELEAALLLQAERNPKLGRLAAKRNLLTFEKVVSIHEYQQLFGLRFGEAAVALGLLNEEELATLLEEQSAHHKYLGEVLVELRILTPTRLNELLEAYYLETGQDPPLSREPALSNP